MAKVIILAFECFLDQFLVKLGEQFAVLEVLIRFHGSVDPMLLKIANLSPLFVTSLVDQDSLEPIANAQNREIPPFVVKLLGNIYNVTYSSLKQDRDIGPRFVDVCVPSYKENAL
jgi:hypothetical protein